MNPNKTIEYNSLSWVKAQLDDVLSDAQSNLNDYIENKNKEDLENCVEHLQLIYGTLQMVEVYGASMLAEEMQYTTTALLEGKVESEYDAYDVLMRAMLQLPDYLESIQSGKMDAPISLMPLINDLRAARNEGLLTEGVLFSPDIEKAELASDEYDAAAIESGKLQDEVKRLRTHYQLGLLDFIRNNKERVGLQRIKAVLNSLEKITSNSEVRHMWMIIAALVEGLLNEGIENNLSVKKLLGAVDRQLKLVLDLGEVEFSNQYSKELVTNILYYVGLSTVESRTISVVKDAYNLADLLPQESDDTSAAIGGLNADLFDTVSKGITEDLAHVKDVLELFMHSNEQSTEQLAPVAEQLGKIGDTYGMLGMGATRQSIMDQRVVLESIVSGEIEVDEKVVLEIASGLLSAESELKDYIAERSGFVDMNRSSENQAVPAAEYRQVVFAVVSEGLKNFGEAKEAIISYVSGEGDKKQLDIILNRLEEVRGVAMMLPLGRIELQIEKLQSFIRIALLDNNHQVTADEQDTVADVVTSIEYFLEALSEGRPGVEQGLNAGDEAASKLVKITQLYGEIEPSVAAEDTVVLESDESINIVIEEGDDNLDLADLEVAGLDTEELDVAEPEVSESIGLEPESSEIAPTVIDAEQFIILADDADEEIVEIFIEEAIEVLGELHEYLPQWRDDTDNEEALAVVRRCFHTLKGSGRLLGAEMIGEFAWRFENILNRVIDQKINISETLHQALDESLAVLPQLIEQLKGNREPIDNISQLMADADAIAEGRNILHDSTGTIELDVQPETDTEIDDVEVAAELDPFDETVAIELVVSEPEASEPQVSEPVDNNIEIVSFDDFSDDLSIGDSSDIDITELDPENNISQEAIVQSDREENINVALDLTAAEEEITTDIDNVEMQDDLDEEVVLLDTGNLADDDFDIEIAEAGHTEVDSDQSVEHEAVIGDAGVDEDTTDEYEIIIDEGDNIVTISSDVLDIDPMLLNIYHDESVSHIEVIREQFAQCEADDQPLKTDEDIIRAFHTLYGSARTAEVEPIAELTGTAEKYIKARQDSGEKEIPDDVAVVLRGIEQSVTSMLEVVAEGKLPASDKALHENINKIFQQEIQSQLQKSWQDNSAVTDEDISIDDNDSLSNEDLDEDLEVISIEDVDDGASDVSEEVEASAKTEDPVQISYGDIDDELIDIFLEEADELLESCEEILDKLKDEPNSTEHIHKLQRNMHTLKGGARMADLASVGDLTHNLESLVVMVNDKKIFVDKAWLDLLQESLDALTMMLAAVKKREPMVAAGELNERVEMIMRGEVEDKRAVERFDVELSELESIDDEDLEEIDIANLLLDRKTDVSEQQDAADQTLRRKEDKRKERPHWGERATDVNFKDSQEQVRVRSDLLNNLVNYAGEVNIYHARMGKQISDFSFNLSELTQTVVRLKEQLRNLEIETEIQIRSGYEKESDAYDDSFDPLEMDQYSTLQQLTRSLSETASDVDSINDILTEITRDSETLLVQESRISTDLQEGLMRTRMVRFGGLSSRLRRIVRQVARELDKEVEVKINGESAEVDRTVLDRIIAPLEHMLRNAVAHGIETPAERKELGKNETGTIIIDVDRQGADVVIKVKDDGAGIDAHKIRQKAVKLGLMAPDAEISDRDALQFILNSGFSTADEVTQVAGRGVGMDVVDSEIKQLGGVLEIDTVRGKGTDFHIRLPLTLAINQALLVSAADDVFAVPLASIEGVVRITGLELQRFYDSDNSHYEFNGVEYELKHLGDLLTGNKANYSKRLQLFPVLLVHVGDQHFALHVEDLIGRREIVVKPVGMQIGSVHGIAGATILADGRVVLILEMSALVVADSLFKAHVSISDEMPVEAVDEVKTIMVVDDSITIRKITERILKRYGINVVLAKDGVDATNQLQEQVPDLMLLDIEMPRMDGFEVASYVRNDDRLKDIPIIMITSRTGSKHKEKAMEIGVDQYLGKPFQEEDLMNHINEILNTSL